MALAGLTGLSTLKIPYLLQWAIHSQPYGYKWNENGSDNTVVYVIGTLVEAESKTTIT